LIGTNATGVAAVPNLTDGIFIGAPANTIGGPGAGARNVISGNGESGIEAAGAGTGNGITGNYIGTDVTGNADLGNALNGVLLESNGNLLGREDEVNVISGNGRSGVAIFNASFNNVYRNFIGTKADGTSPLGNTQWGVAVNGGTQNHIGSPDPTLVNTIAYNGLDGVTVVGASRCPILLNSIFANGGLGIDLNDDGVSANDAGDADAGANNMQNYPVLTSVKTGASATTVTGSLNSTPSATFRIEFFASPAGDPTGFGEGQTYLDGTFVTTDASGNASFSMTLPIVPVGQLVAAIATGGNTYITDGYSSEFSATVAATDAIPPAVASGAFDFDLPNPGALPHRLRYAFGENVSASLAPADLLLQNLTTGQTVSSGSIALSYDTSTNTATFTFPGLPAGVVSDGRYRAALLAAGITDAAGNTLDGDNNGTPGGDHLFDFFFLAGDANHDATVDLLDFNILAANFGQSNRTFSQGDFDYNGTVNLLDFNILSQRFGTSVAPQADATALAPRRSSPFSDLFIDAT
jgi:hypothetical protein